MLEKNRAVIFAQFFGHSGKLLMMEIFLDRLGI
jgi:hypothetical protein